MNSNMYAAIKTGITILLANIPIPCGKVLNAKASLPGANSMQSYPSCYGDLRRWAKNKRKGLAVRSSSGIV